MRVGILVSRIRVEEKMIVAEMERQGVDFDLLDLRAQHFDLHGGTWSSYDVVLDRCVSHTQALAALHCWRAGRCLA